MPKKILVGTDNFEKLISGNGYYVDKTELLYELVEVAANEVTLFTRPRRFGKTLTMSMMENFFSIHKPESRALFDGLKIQKHEKFCVKWMNRYPTLFISFKDVEASSYEQAYAMLVGEISKLCIQFASLELEEKVDAADAATFHRLKYKEASEEEIKNALQTIMRMMHMVYGKRVILLIDEYDVPLAKAQANGYYHDMLETVRGMLSTSLKTNDHLMFAVVTGCLRIPKESIFTGVNNFASYSVLDDDYSQYFGFSQNEMEELLRDFGMEEKMDVIREWYDGYVFGMSQMYCPWDAMNYVSDLCRRRTAKPKPYWENTSGNDAIKRFFDMGTADISDKLEALLNGEAITESVTNALTYEEAYASEENLWSVLLMAGYVTAISQNNVDSFGEEADEGFRQAVLRIPNREIAAIFQRAVVDHFYQSADENEIRELMKALWDGDEEKASGLLSDLLWNTISYMDYHEDYYHAFLAGIFVGRGGYAVQSNKERGLGRPDIDLRDKKNRRALIIEAKKSDSAERMAYWCDDAIRQIIEQEYAKNMKGYKEVLCYGISFFEKSAMVKLLKDL